MRRVNLLLVLFWFPLIGYSQHDHHINGIMEDSTMAKLDTDSMQISHAHSMSLPMSRNGSGTGWLPDESPMYMHMKKYGKWGLMFHGSIFIRYNKQDIAHQGNRGDSQFDAPNYFMMMAQRKVARNGLFNFNIMMSMDRLTVGGNGYPLLFQSGETWGGNPLVDRQHPHDLLDELSLAYTQKLNKNIDITGYIGYPGEPALGPVTFMHRISAISNPDAPLGHHWQDATHITFGVATIGLRYKKFKIEASSFTGREPDENRYNFDKPRFDSYSYRFLFNPSKQWALQVSRGFIKSPELLHPAENVEKITASAMHTTKWSEDKYLATSFIYGQNKIEERRGSVLIETHFQSGKTGVYGRYEWIQKDTTELSLKELNTDLITINAITLGLSYNLLDNGNGIFAIGVQSTLNISDSHVSKIYGSYPYSGEVYLHFIPPLMKMMRNDKSDQQ